MNVWATLYRMTLMSLCAVFFLQTGKAQPTLGGYFTHGPVFHSYQEQMAGATQPAALHVTISLKQVTHLTDWKIRVRALGGLTNPDHPMEVIPANYAALQFNSVNKSNMAPANQNPIPLSSSGVELVSGTPDLEISQAGYYLNYSFDLQITGGTHLLIPNGTYKTLLEFSLFDGDNNLVDTYVTLPVYFSIQVYGSGGGSGLKLQNGANLISFAFTQPADYATGLTITKPLGLKVVSYQKYQVLVQTDAAVLTHAAHAATIPVSAVDLSVTQTQKNLPGLIMNTAALSPSPKTYIDNPVPNQPYHELTYNLTYSIPQTHTAQLMNKPPGMYHAKVYFILVPQ